jgi:hypothetical protein
LVDAAAVEGMREFGRWPAKRTLEADVEEEGEAGQSCRLVEGSGTGLMMDEEAVDTRRSNQRQTQAGHDEAKRMGEEPNE